VNRRKPSRILFLGAMMGFWFFITQFLQNVYVWSPLLAGGLAVRLAGIF
jgi:hypothetical protein